MIKLLKIAAARPGFNELMRNEINNGIAEADTQYLTDLSSVLSSNLLNNI